MRVTSPRAAAAMQVFFPPDNPIVAAAIDETQIEGFDRLGDRSSSSWWRWRYYGIPRDGFLLELTVRGDDPVEIRLTDLSYGLPDIDGYQYQPRFDYMMPHPYSMSDQTLVAKSFTFQ